MNKHRQLLVAFLAGIAVAWAVGWLYRTPALGQLVILLDKAAAAEADEAKPESPELAAIRKTAEDFVKAFNKGDAKAVAAFWTKEGEFIGADGDTVRGRAAIEKGYLEFFKKNQKAELEVKIESLRLLGKHTALEEGWLKVRLPGDKEPGVSRYSVLHVREDDGWRMASVREWVPNPAELITLKDIEWLIGDWLAKTDEAELHISYAWDEDKAFLRGRYHLKRGGKAASSGTQIVGKDPAGGLRSWVFDSSGTYGESTWSRDGDRWVMHASGTLPDGSEVTAVNLMIPIGKDAFTWQSIERTAAGSPVPDSPPLRVNRVKADK